MNYVHILIGCCMLVANIAYLAYLKDLRHNVSNRIDLHNCRALLEGKFEKAIEEAHRYRCFTVVMALIIMSFNTVIGAEVVKTLARDWTFYLTAIGWGVVTLVYAAHMSYSLQVFEITNNEMMHRYGLC